MKGIAKTILLFLIAGLLFASCKPGYKVYAPVYATQFQEQQDSVPKYSNLVYWAAHPWKKDPSDSIPAPLKKKQIDSTADVFFIHPTTLTQKELNGVVWNASINDAAINLKTDYTSILYQASVFNADARVFAPRYRQAHLYSFYAKDTASSHRALELAYADVRAAFVYYLEHFNRGRPIIIASHSQGTYHAGRLLKEFFEKKPLQQQLVCAYLWGLVIPKNYLTDLPPCPDSTATGCFAGWRTFRKNYVPNYVKQEHTGCWVVNPLNWTLQEEPVSRSRNEGAVLFNFNKVLHHTNGAQIKNGVVWIEKPRIPLGFLSSRKNYHPGDMNLFYMSIRSNVHTRIQSYLSKQAQ